MDLVLAEARQSKFSARERITRMGLSIAEQLRAEGRAEGKAEGLSIAEQLRAESKAESKAEGKAESKAEGKAEGQVQEARRFLLRQLRARFGELPAAVPAWVEGADLEQCEAMGERLLRADSLAELGFSVTQDGETSSAS